MNTWWRVVAGFLTGAANVLANGTNWKQILVSASLAAMGVVSHLSSTSDVTTVTKITPGKTVIR
jgi:hypothetical protein